MWYETATIYQIYTLGFCGCPLHNDGQTVSRIKKVLSWKDYLKEMGFDTILFNPVFQSETHGYDAMDIRQIDCRLGTNEDFATVVDELHKSDIKVILDGVFNHVGREFWAFKDVRQNKQNSKYNNWFHIDYNRESGNHDGFYYEGWEGHYDLVKLNLKNPEVIDYLFETISIWINDFHIDGIRLDVAYLLDDDFLRKLRAHCKGIKQDCFLIGEIIGGNYNRIANPQMLDACTNYICYKGLYSSYNDENLFEISYSLNQEFGSNKEAIYANMMMMNFADNHDVTRLASIVRKQEYLKLVYGTMFSMPGVPCIYYGSEWGMQGKKQNGDQELRPYFENSETNELSHFIKRIIAIRSKTPELLYGNYRNVVIRNKQLIFERSLDGSSIYIAINLDSESYLCQCELYMERAKELIMETEMVVKNNILMPPYSIQIVKAM